MPISKEQLVAQGTAISIHLGRAAETFKRVFTDPVREYLFGFPAQRTELFGGLLKPRLQISKPKPNLDEHRIMEDLRDLVFAGGISAQELKTLVLNGGLEVAVPEMVAELTAPRMNKAVTAYSVATPGKPGFIVRWDVKGGEDAKNMVAHTLGALGDLSGRIEAAAESSFPPDSLRPLAP